MIRAAGEWLIGFLSLAFVWFIWTTLIRTTYKDWKRRRHNAKLRPDQLDQWQYPEEFDD